LIGGETGTGKELFAHSIHHSSKRVDGPFVCVNCASIPTNLLESELFGYAPGAFTGANRNGKAGKIEMSNSGTLFLDEIGELPPMSQAKLLRVLEEKRVERVGNLLPVKVDFRLIAATNRKIDFLKDNTKFRQDLYYRLSTMSIMIPSLRDRAEDIPVLIDHFIQKSAANPLKISDGALDVLMHYAWPGNVRELKSIIDLFLCLAPKDNVIKRVDLPQHIIESVSIERPPKRHEDFDLNKRAKNDELHIIKQCLRYCKGNKRQAAKLLGISRSSLYNKIKQLSLS
jgi:transcriptional regulator with PAS, ATPase and Fis domain